MAIEVPYQEWLDGIKRPLIDIELTLPNRKLYSTKALVDSGADSCVFDIEIFEKPGIDISQYPSRNCTAAGGRTGKEYPTLCHPEEAAGRREDLQST